MKDEDFVKAVIRAAEEKGYKKRTDGVWVTCNISPSGLTTADIIRAIYNHIAKNTGLKQKSQEEITSELVINASASQQSSFLQNECNEVCSHISKIGDVVFECDVYPTEINITKVEENYGSMEALIKGLWEQRVKGLAALKTQDENTRWEEI